MAIADDVFTSLEQGLEWQRDLYKELHRNPELSMEEHRTADRIEQELTGFGYQVQRIGGTGVVGVLDNGSGRTVLSRADIDALPVTEATGLDYASENEGVMHACGHDMHIASLLGAAKLMAAHRDGWAGTHVALFQPGEETAAGAQAMVDDGLAAKLPKPDVAFGQHVMPFEVGTIGTTAGPILSAGDSLKVTVHGRGAHGSMPHNAVDPVVLAASIVLRLQTIVSRETKPGEFAVVTVGASNAGTKSNIIPDRAELLLNLRTYDVALRERIMASIERIVRGECAAAGSPRDPEFEYYDQFPLTNNDAATTQKITGRVHRAFWRQPGLPRRTGHGLRGLQPDSRRVRRSVHLLDGGLRPGRHVPESRGERHCLPRHSGESFTVLLPRHRPDALDRHPGADRGRTSLFGTVKGCFP